MGEGEPSLKEAMSQLPLEIVAGQDAASEECLKIEGMNSSRNREHEERLPPLESDWNSGSKARSERLLLAAKLEDEKLWNDDFRLTTMHSKIG